MVKTMTLERATEFGSAWNSGDADLVASFFADDAVYHASVGPDRLGKTYVGKAEIRKGVIAFFERFPDGKFENLKSWLRATLGHSSGTLSRLMRAESRSRPLDATFLPFEVKKS